MSRCNKCNQYIEFTKTKEGWRPYNPKEGTWHFDTCKPAPKKSEAQQLREMKRNFAEANNDKWFELMEEQRLED